MARLVQEAIDQSNSDDEFPDVKCLLEGVKPTKRGGTSTSASKVASKSTSALKPRLKRTDTTIGVTRVKNLTRRKDVESLCVAEEVEIPDALRITMAEKSLKKKRVLTKRDDNPLLRPIEKTAREECVGMNSVKLHDWKARLKNRTGRNGRRMCETASVEDEESIEGVVEESNDDDPIEKPICGHPSTEEDPARNPGSNLFGSKDLLYRNRKQPKLERHIAENDVQQGMIRSRGENVSKNSEHFCKGSGVSQGALCKELAHVMEPVAGELRNLVALAENLNAKEFDSSVTKDGLRGTSGTLRSDGENLPLRDDDQNLLHTKSKVNPQMSTSRTGKSKPSRTINLDSDDEVAGFYESFEEPDVLKPQKSRKHRQSPPRTKSRFILTDTEEEDSPEDEASEGMSDFIVSDNEPLEEIEDDSVFEIPPPSTRSARKLFRGRKPTQPGSEDDEDLDPNMRRLRLNDENAFVDILPRTKVKGEDHSPLSPKKLPAKSSLNLPSQSEAAAQYPSKTKRSGVPPPSSDIDEPFILRFSPPVNKRKISKGKISKDTRFATPPGSPKVQPRLLPSPIKLPRIPSSPHRQSSEAFWSQDVVNDWNDEYSPRKTPAPTLRPIMTADGTLLFSPSKSPIKQTRLTKDAKKAFSQIRHELADSFLKELDEKITDGKIAEMAASTGGVKIIWSKKLNTTAGRANWKRETIRSQHSDPSQPAPPPRFRHHAAIELAEKVIDDRERLLNVIAHEFCHLANFMISNIRTNPHGREFKAWAAKCSAVFGKRGIEVTTKHSYEIEYKYVWECENCGMEFKRHSKSIDIGKHRCGVCKCKLVQIKPVPRGADKGRGGLSGYQAFVKENLAKIKSENPGSPHKVVMGLVGKKYQEFKANQLREESMESGSQNGSVESKEGTPENDIGMVVRKLDFLDLTGP